MSGDQNVMQCSGNCSVASARIVPPGMISFVNSDAISILAIDCNKITIGDNVLIAPGVQINTASHPVEWKERRNPEFPDNPQAYFCKTYAKPMTIGNGCWIGAGAILLGGVTFGDNVIVAAEAVVTKSFPGTCLIGGVPARIIKRFAERR